MKTKIILFALFSSLFSIPAQNRTIVNSTSSEISDNLDLRAIASIFGEVKNLDDFERQLNDPEIQLSNLDLNNDNEVDYLRVIESVEANTHLIIIQCVLGRDTFQDVATIEVEKDRNNTITVQVVGDVYMYGDNNIYEPIYEHRPLLFTSFWRSNYNPYYSNWHWNNYPRYYYSWSPFSVFRYRNNVSLYIDHNNHYNYTNFRNSRRAIGLHERIRENQHERQYPNRSFAYRNSNYKNSQELNEGRKNRNVESGNNVRVNRTKFLENNLSYSQENNHLQNNGNIRKGRNLNNTESISGANESYHRNSNKGYTASSTGANTRRTTNESKINTTNDSNYQNTAQKTTTNTRRTRNTLNQDNSQNRNTYTSKGISSRGL